MSGFIFVPWVNIPREQGKEHNGEANIAIMLRPVAITSIKLRIFLPSKSYPRGVPSHVQAVVLRLLETSAGEFRLADVLGLHVYGSRSIEMASAAHGSGETSVAVHAGNTSLTSTRAVPITKP